MSYTFNLLISLTYLIMDWRGLPGPNDAWS